MKTKRRATWPSTWVQFDPGFTEFGSVFISLRLTRARFRAALGTRGHFTRVKAMVHAGLSKGNNQIERFGNSHFDRAGSSKILMRAAIKGNPKRRLGLRPEKRVERVATSRASEPTRRKETPIEIKSRTPSRPRKARSRKKCPNDPFFGAQECRLTGRVLWTRPRRR